jgi:hypothetical protein
MHGCGKMVLHHRTTTRDNSMPSTSPRAAVSGPQTQRKRPGDLTGVNSQKLVAERDDAQAQETADAEAAKAAERAEKVSTVVDYTAEGQGRGRPEVVEEAVVVHPKEMTIRVNYPIEQMTWGREVIQQPEYDDAGVCTRPPILGGLKTYDFEEGVQYRVPFDLGAHLKSLGYVYDF